MITFSHIIVVGLLLIDFLKLKVMSWKYDFNEKQEKKVVIEDDELQLFCEIKRHRAKGTSLKYIESKDFVSIQPKNIFKSMVYQCSFNITSLKWLNNINRNIY